MKMLVGITGFKRCGKGETAKRLHDHFGFEEYGFANALRTMAAAVDPFIVLSGSPPDLLEQLGASSASESRPYSYLYATLGYELAKGIPDFRRFLQRLGTEGVRGTFGPNAWVDALQRSIENNAPTRVAISDVRFSSEADFILRQGGLLWRVNRPGFGGDDPHPSEAEIPSLPASRDITATSLAELDSAIISAAKEDLGLSVQPTAQVHPHASSSSTSTSERTAADDSTGASSS